MTNQNQATKVKRGKQSQRSVEPAVVAEPAGDMTALFELPTGRIAAAGVRGPTEAQAAWLHPGRLQDAQRRSSAIQIGRVQGNRHLQRVVASLKREEETAGPVQIRPQTSASLTVPREVEEEEKDATQDRVENAQARGDATKNPSILQFKPAEKSVIESAFADVSDIPLVASWIAQGTKNETRLTNKLFYHRHPEIEPGTKLRPGTPQAEEWIAIRDRIVRPALESSPEEAPVQPVIASLESILRPLGRKLKELVSELDSVAKAPSPSKKEMATVKTEVEGKMTETLQAAVDLERELRQKHPGYAEGKWVEVKDDPEGERLKGLKKWRWKRISGRRKKKNLEYKVWEPSGFVGYGTKKEGPGKYVCTTFALKVFKEAGYDVSGEFGDRLNVRLWRKRIKDFPIAERKAEKLRRQKEMERLVREAVAAKGEGDERLKGVVYALVKSNQGDEIEVSQLQPGDFVQYWYGAASGHVVQVADVIPGKGKALAIWAHGSHGGDIRAYDDPSKRGRHGVGLIRLPLLKESGAKADWLKLIYCVRPRPIGSRSSGKAAPSIQAPMPEKPAAGKSKKGVSESIAGPLKTSLSLEQAIAAGERREGRLTNLVFHNRHPEREGKSIDPTRDLDLIEEWKTIRADVV
jgi:hypothetical protein